MVLFTEACIEVLKDCGVNVANIQTVHDYDKVYHQLSRKAKSKDLMHTISNKQMIELGHMKEMVREIYEKNNALTRTFLTNIEELKEVFGSIEVESPISVSEQQDEVRENQQIALNPIDLNVYNEQLKRENEVLKRENEVLKNEIYEQRKKYKKLCSKLINNDSIFDVLEKDEIRELSRALAEER